MFSFQVNWLQSGLTQCEDTPCVLRSDIFSVNRLRSVLLLYCMQGYTMTRESLHCTAVVLGVMSTGKKPTYRGHISSDVLPSPVVYMFL